MNESEEEEGKLRPSVVPCGLEVDTETRVPLE